MATSIRNIKECAVGLHLGDGLCFTNKYVSENSSLITLDDSETSRTIRYRLNLKNIQTICLHHKMCYNHPIIICSLLSTRRGCQL
jgi:hypothetical protein